MGLGSFLAGWTLAGLVMGFLAGIISFIALVIYLYAPAMAFMASYHLVGLLALVVYIGFALTIIPIVAGLIGFIVGTVGGFIVGLITGVAFGD